MTADNEGGFADFERGWSQGRPQVVIRRLVDDLETPVSAFLTVGHGLPHAFLLESVEGGAVNGRYSIITREPDVVWRCRGGAAELARAADIAAGGWHSLALSGGGGVYVWGRGEYGRCASPPFLAFFSRARGRGERKGKTKSFSRLSKRALTLTKKTFFSSPGSASATARAPPASPPSASAPSTASPSSRPLLEARTPPRSRAMAGSSRGGGARSGAWARATSVTVTLRSRCRSPEALTGGAS